MEILDGKSHKKADQPFFLGVAVDLLNSGKHWGLLPDRSTAPNYTPEALKRAHSVFTNSFRALVNQWIDSGKNPDGIESPLSRNIRDVPPGYTSPLFDTLRAWLNRNMPRPGLMNSGKVAILVQAPSAWTTDECGLVKYHEPQEYAKEWATYEFKELLDTDGAHRLTRCNNPECGRYYLRERLRKSEIKRGTFCERCRGFGSQVRTRATRKKRKETLVTAAADHWPGWRASPRYGKRSDWVASKVNADQREDKITGKWVSQNRKAIENEIQRREHAKS